VRLAFALLILGVRFNSTGCFIAAAACLVAGALIDAVDEL
jgi:hypothetical protein